MKASPLTVLSHYNFIGDHHNIEPHNRDSALSESQEEQIANSSVISLIG